jgi:hypothetical protein
MLRRQSLKRNVDRHRRHLRVQCDLRAQERRFGEDHVVRRDVRRREKSPLSMERAGSAMRAFGGPHLIFGRVYRGYPAYVLFRLRRLVPMDQHQKLSHKNRAQGTWQDAQQRAARMRTGTGRDKRSCSG